MRLLASLRAILLPPHQFRQLRYLGGGAPSFVVDRLIIVNIDRRAYLIGYSGKYVDYGMRRAGELLCVRAQHLLDGSDPGRQTEALE